jgi:hypothetical protein
MSGDYIRGFTVSNIFKLILLFLKKDTKPEMCKVCGREHTEQELNVMIQIEKERTKQAEERTKQEVEKTKQEEKKTKQMEVAEKQKQVLEGGYDHFINAIGKPEIRGRETSFQNELKTIKF